MLRSAQLPLQPPDWLAGTFLLWPDDWNGPSEESSMSTSRAARRVLVVDDNVDAADMLAAVLRLRGAEVHVAYSGELALALAASCEPQAIVLDLAMPGLD